jgi:hypothetical protein
MCRWSVTYQYCTILNDSNKGVTCDLHVRIYAFEQCECDLGQGHEISDNTVLAELTMVRDEGVLTRKRLCHFIISDHTHHCRADENQSRYCQDIARQFKYMTPSSSLLLECLLHITWIICMGAFPQIELSKLAILSLVLNFCFLILVRVDHSFPLQFTWDFCWKPIQMEWVDGKDKKRWYLLI